MITSGVEIITPEIAKSYLEKNKRNFRAINKGVVQTYAKEMKSGLWKENGEPIQFSESGILLNGQHRLNAIILANVAVPIMVVRGIKDDVFVFDRCSKRTIPQFFKAKGMRISSSEIGAIALIANGFNHLGCIGDEELFQFYENNNPERFDKAEAFCHRGAQSPIGKKAAVIAAVYCALTLNVISEADAEVFCRIVNTGLPEDGVVAHAPLQLRKTFQKGFSADNGDWVGYGASPRKMYFETTFLALQDFQKGKKPMRMYKPDGKGKEIIEKTREALKKDMISD